jgi:hypothetical protein
MPFYTDNTIETMMAFNSFAPQFNPQSLIPSYDDWLANNSFDPFSPEEGVGIGNRAHRGYGSTWVDMKRDVPQEVRSDPPLD